MAKVQAQVVHDQKHIEVTMRMIGHEVLLAAGDSTSLVMPIEKVGNSYRIRFGSDFEFNPDDLVSTISSVLLDADMEMPYIVEVTVCGSDTVVYSYEMGGEERTDIIPCRERDLPTACYSIAFTLLTDVGEEEADASSNSTLFLGKWTYGILLCVLVLASVFFIYWRKKRKSDSPNPHLIAIGKYQFNKQNAKLILEQQVIELSGKESELLQLLHSAVNTTVDRATIQRLVWGDDGDYVGRTLDVFISKLRKKLEADPNVQIVNIRGVGYKLVIDAD